MVWRMNRRGGLDHTNALIRYILCSTETESRMHTGGERRLCKWKVEVDVINCAVSHEIQGNLRLSLLNYKQTNVLN